MLDRVDIAQAHILVLRFLSKLGLRIYNVGLGKGYSIQAVVKAVEKVADVPRNAWTPPQ